MVDEKYAEGEGLVSNQIEWNLGLVQGNLFFRGWPHFFWFSGSRVVDGRVMRVWIDRCC